MQSENVNDEIKSHSTHILCNNRQLVNGNWNDARTWLNINTLWILLSCSFIHAQSLSVPFVRLRKPHYCLLNIPNALAFSEQTITSLIISHILFFSWHYMSKSRNYPTLQFGICVYLFSSFVIAIVAIFAKARMFVVIYACVSLFFMQFRTNNFVHM